MLIPSSVTASEGDGEMLIPSMTATEGDGDREEMLIPSSVAAGVGEKSSGEGAVARKIGTDSLYLSMIISRELVGSPVL